MSNIIKVGGGGGGSSVIVSKTITQNGTYNASADSANGYNPVIVNVSGGGVTHIAWTNEQHTIGDKRSISIDGYVLNAPCTQSTYCTGVISVPFTMPQGANAIIMTYDLVGESYTSTQWYATLFASDNVVTNEIAKQENYNYEQLKQSAISSGSSITNLTNTLSGDLLPATSSFYLNIQFGVNNFANIRLYALTL